MFYNKDYIKQELCQWRNIRPFAKTMGASVSNLEKKNIHSCARHIVLYKILSGLWHMNYTK